MQPRVAGPCNAPAGAPWRARSTPRSATRAAGRQRRGRQRRRRQRRHATARPPVLLAQRRRRPPVRRRMATAPARCLAAQRHRDGPGSGARCTRPFASWPHRLRGPTAAKGRRSPDRAMPGAEVAGTATAPDAWRG